MTLTRGLSVCVPANKVSGEAYAQNKDSSISKVSLRLSFIVFVLRPSHTRRYDAKVRNVI